MGEAVDAQESQTVSSEIKKQTVVGERIPQEKVSAIAVDFGSFYGLPSETIERAKQAEAYYVDEDEFTQAYKEQVREDLMWAIETAEQHTAETNSIEYSLLKRENQDLQRLKEHPEELEVLIAKIAGQIDSRTLGKSISKRDGKELIIIRKTVSPKNRKFILEHEMLHVLSSSGFEGGTGFVYYDPLLGYLNNSLNEGTTQAMLLHKRYPAATMHRITDFLRKNPDFLYADETNKVLNVLNTTNLPGGIPFSIMDLSKHYFSQRTSMLVDKSQELIQNLEQHALDRYKPLVRMDMETLALKDLPVMNNQ